MNKKGYLSILGVATTMLGAMVLSSCSHDEYYYSEEKAEQKVEQSITDKYAAAFEKAFGKVGPNVDWGFSNKKSNTRAFTRAIQPSIPFPSDCDASKFDPDLTETPSYEAYLKSKGTQYWTPEEINGYAEVYTDKVQAIKINGGTEQQHAILYIKEGTYDFTGVLFYLGKNVDLVLLEGATVKLDNDVASNAIFDIYIAEGAELIANGDNGLVANSGSHVYNHGTITCSRFEVNSTSFLYNVGTLEAGSVNAESNDSRIVNDGTIDCASVTVNAGAVQNNDEWIVSGTTSITSPNSGWVNNGKWKTQNYSYVGGSVNVINNCFLWVTEDFEMNISSDSTEGDKAFKMDSGSGVLTKNFYGGRDSSTGAISGPFKIIMGQNSVFKVEETAVLESGRSSFPDLDKYEFGFFGPSEGYAVFQAKDIIREESIKNTWGAVTYGDNLYVYAETHFAQGNDGLSTHPYIIKQGSFSIDNNIYAAGFNSGKPSITIEETNCCPGFQGGDPLYRVIAEDLSASESGDFDFNDVVFDVVKAENGKTTLKLICAGGVLPLRVRGENETVGREIHEVFGDTTPMLDKHPMYNTGKGPNAPATEFTVEGTYTDPVSIKKIIIEVYKENQWMELKANTGEAACKILVDDTFVPVSETTNIADDYGKFTDYVQGHFDGDFWWKWQ
jgi:hypothetical protein